MCRVVGYVLIVILFRGPTVGGQRFKNRLECATTPLRQLKRINSFASLFDYLRRGDNAFRRIKLKRTLGDSAGEVDNVL